MVDMVWRKLPEQIAVALRIYGINRKTEIEEIRLRTGRPLYITRHGQNEKLPLLCTEALVQETLRLLCDGSLYAHAETLRDGYICVGEGVRAGVCGRAVLQNGKIAQVSDITSIDIRISKRVPGVADDMYAILVKRNFSDSILFFGAPISGKTTMLRELAALLSQKKRVALVDTREELSAGLQEGEMLDILSGYPRTAGMQIALRSLSPEYIFCDELVEKADIEAVRTCVGSGVRLCASVHADSPEALRSRFPEVVRFFTQFVFLQSVGNWRICTPSEALEHGI